MSEDRFKYFSVKILHSELLLEFVLLEDFVRFLQTHRISTIFKLLNETNEVSHFAVSYKGGLMRQDSEGFENIEDYLVSRRENFPTSESFYISKKLGYKNYQEYKIALESGIENIEDFILMKSKGFIEGYAEWNKNKSFEPVFANPFELLRFALENNFENYTELKSGFEKGFKNGGIFRIATAKGFSNFADYAEAEKFGVQSFNELNKIRSNNIRDINDYHNYLDLELIKTEDTTHDQRVLQIILSKLPDGRKVSINKLIEYYTKELENYIYPDTGEMPKWFTLGFDGKESIVKFLTFNNAVKKYGHYDNDGEYFETKVIQSRTVIIDGSNVAFNSISKKEAKAKIENVILVVNELKKRGFTAITVIADASLRYRIEDKDRLQELKKLVNFIEAPAENQADIFILQLVKKEHCLLISNDVFRDWKLLDPWIALNIDYYRISFMIKEDTVLLPDLDK